MEPENNPAMHGKKDLEGVSPIKLPRRNADPSSTQVWASDVSHFNMDIPLVESDVSHFNMDFPVVESNVSHFNMDFPVVEVKQ